MAMYVFQELQPKVFYFTYCLQEIQKYIQMIEDPSENGTHKVNESLISKEWIHHDGYDEKIFSSDLSGQEKPIDLRTLFLINNLKATFHYCFGQYKLFNNIQEDVNLDTTYSVKKYFDGSKELVENKGKYTARLYINSSYDGGEVLLPTRGNFKPESGSIIIAPSDMIIDSLPVANNSKYVAIGHWI